MHFLQVAVFRPQLRRKFAATKSPVNILELTNPARRTIIFVAVSIPFQSGPGPDAKSLSNFRRNGNLPL